MPKNNDLKPVTLPMPIRFNKEGKTDVKILENAISVKLVDGPTQEQILSFLPGYVNATWMEDTSVLETMTDQYRIESMIKMFTGKTLPTALETIRFTFLIDGMALQEVTHLLRHRTASISAVCTGDRFMHNDDVLVPEAIANSPEFYDRYVELAEMSKQLYIDMVDTKEISLMDARYALHRSSRQTYYCSLSYKDLLGFVRQRIDRAIQPKADNLIAYEMWLAACEQVPVLAALDLVDFDAPSFFFIKTARTGHSTNLYFPETHNDKFEWNEKDFIYGKTRPEMNGTDPEFQIFEDRLNYSKLHLQKIKDTYVRLNPEIAATIEKLKAQV